MKKQLHYVLAAAFIVSVISCTDHEIENEMSELDRSFIMSAADGNLFEVKAGEIAVNKAMMDSVREFGKHMVMDHTKASEELKMVAEKNGVNIPPYLSEEKMKKIDSLSMLSGMEFDKKYMKMMVLSHKETVALFDMEFQSGMNHDVRSFAGSKLSTLRYHLLHAEALEMMLW
jgi:putative membrane protein